MIGREYYGSDGSYHQILSKNEFEMELQIQKIENSIKCCKSKKEKNTIYFFRLLSKLFL